MNAVHTGIYSIEGHKALCAMLDGLARQYFLDNDLLAEYSKTNVCLKSMPTAVKHVLPRCKVQLNDDMETVITWSTSLSLLLEVFFGECITAESRRGFLEEAGKLLKSALSSFTCWPNSSGIHVDFNCTLCQEAKKHSIPCVVIGRDGIHEIDAKHLLLACDALMDSMSSWSREDVDAFIAGPLDPIAYETVCTAKSALRQAAVEFNRAATSNVNFFGFKDCLQAASCKTKLFNAQTSMYKTVGTCLKKCLPGHKSPDISILRKLLHSSELDTALYTAQWEL